jgi:hypothetical protein
MQVTTYPGRNVGYGVEHLGLVARNLSTLSLFQKSNVRSGCPVELVGLKLMVSKSTNYVAYCQKVCPIYEA